MIRRVMLLLLAAALVLTACNSAVSTALPTATRTLIILPPQPTATPEERVQAPAGCTVASRLTGAEESPESSFPAVSAADWRYGPEDAAFTLIEYSDFQCVYCARLAPLLKQVQAEFPDEVQIVFRHFPLIGSAEQPGHDKAALAAQAAEAAGKQKKFWEMHDLLFERQAEWAAFSVAEFEPWLQERAAELGLDEAQFAADLTSSELVQKSQAAWDFGVQLGMDYVGTPYLLMDGQPWPNSAPMDYWSLTAIIRLTLLERRQFSSCPPMNIDPNQRYLATIATERGPIVIELLADKAPLAVNNFIFLAKAGWYDGVTFHRVLPGYIAQAGDPTGTGFGGPGYAFVNEIDESLTFDRAGLVAMANAGPDSNGSQFFITFAPATQLNGGYTIFGRVIQGMDVALSLAPRNPQEDINLPPGDKIITIRIEEK